MNFINTINGVYQLNKLVCLDIFVVIVLLLYSFTSLLFELYFFFFSIVVLKQQTPQQGQMVQAPQSLMQMPNNWNNLPGTSNGNVSLPNAAVGVNSSIASQIEAINAQQMTLQEQIRQSEQNLSAQHNVKKKLSRTHTNNYVAFPFVLFFN